MPAQSDDFWEKAKELLDPDDKATLDSTQSNKLDYLAEVLELANKSKATCIQKRIKYTRRSGETVIIRDLFEKIIRWVDTFKGVVDVAIQFDPLHAALPWAGIRFVLQVGGSLVELEASTQREIPRSMPTNYSIDCHQ